MLEKLEEEAMVEFLTIRTLLKLYLLETKFPEDKCLPGTDVMSPYCIVGDAAFPLKTYLMRPYPCRCLPGDKAIFTYRLSRARRTIENAFGLLSAKWRIFRRPIVGAPKKAINMQHVLFKIIFL